MQQPAGLVDRAKAGDVKAIELMSSGMLATFGRPLGHQGWWVVKKTTGPGVETPMVPR